MLSLVNIRKDYGKFTAIEDLNLELEEGLYAMLAPNGAGKTTIIRMMTTLLFPTSGEILYDGENILEMGESYRKMVGYLPQQFGYYKSNTPVQYLSYLAALKKIPRQEAKRQIPKLLELVGLSEEANKKMKKFSGGMIQRVGIAQALLGDPKILILDEPTAGLDPKERVRFRNLLSSMSRNRIVVLSTHIVSDVESVANQVMLLKDHRLLLMDTVPNICSRYQGKIYEKKIREWEYEEFARRHMVLSVRQEQDDSIVVRFCREKDLADEPEARACAPNMEDVFLLTYR
ncbi:MAG TPA: ABC transporter ATP-binding protein [Candidatus Pullilachnospira gallistercoris]|uniref:ABC transporter ATP-binding protein n=1 Tax=Candidatus Pullilachnospira gallistercoris TaxID=2840911 RepID=A0A9D1JAA6_9FIRM|nr:ABC transporter ATP-binding protein [Candidatus Pullilachnospira gallistercoris]